MSFAITPVSPGQAPLDAGDMPQYIQFRFNGVDLGGPDASVLDIVGAGFTFVRGTGAAANKVTLTLT